ncbi:MAG TPA: lipid-A-disaccharide synthase [Terracidiphilus sp.]|nr:lipid-A-disaccharide synthase [Terracidiphilus sp.]
MSPTLFISAGEASGEHYGALLVTALKRRLDAVGVQAKLFGIGGPRMEAAGLERVVHAEDMAVMGLTEVVLHLPRIYREFRKLRKAIRTCRPDMAVLIDFPEIHFRLAKEFHRLGVPVIYFVSPQLWAWKKKRIKLVQQYVRRMLVIFPFEEPFYRERGVDAEFVGHPLAELPAPSISREQFAAQNGLDPGKTWIGLLPGSRVREIHDHLPEMLRAARILFSHAQPRGLEFIVPLAPTLNAAQRQQVAALIVRESGGLVVRLAEDARATLFHARASVVASGTATVEAALIGNPFIVVYRVSALTYAMAKRMVKVPHVAMANLIAGKRLVPELIQHDFTAAKIVQQLEPLLPDGPERQSMIEGLGSIRDALGVRLTESKNDNSGAIDRVAAVILEELKISSATPGAAAPDKVAAS